MLEKKPGEVIFRKGQLVQIYRSDLRYTFIAERKLVSKWLRPFQVKERIANSYKLETLDGQEIKGEFHARRLRSFKPREGTRLAKEQREFKEALEKEERDSQVESDEDTAFLKTGAHGTGDRHSSN